MKLGPSSLISLNLSIFIRPTSGAEHLLFMMRFMNLFDQAFQVASENSYLYLKPKKLINHCRDLISFLSSFIRRKFTQKICASNFK